MNRTLLLFTVIIVEGYVVLATELLALRESMLYVGNGTDTVSIIIAAVLMPLAFGYYYGGQFRPHRRRGVHIGVRRKLIFNILVSLIILSVGLSYTFMNIFFLALADMGIRSRLVMTAIYSAAFLVPPVFLLGQTIPLVSNYFTKEKLSRITGYMLFVSTLGSFLGAVFSTLVLMSTIGVHNTVSVNCVLLALLVVLLSKNKKSEQVLFALGATIIALYVNSGYVMRSQAVVDNNRYNTIKAFTDENGNRHLSLNHMRSSMYNEQTGQKHPYVEFFERQIIDPIRGEGEPRDILIVGAGGFTLGLEDEKNNYEYVDIDGNLRKISEEHFLGRKLTANKKFIPLDARAFLKTSEKKYDVIVLDAYLGDITIPEHLVTQEFYQLVKDHVKEYGIVAANFIVPASFSSPFSRHIDDTFRSVFHYVSRYSMYDQYRLWDNDPNRNNNIIYLYRHNPDEDSREIYTDNINRVFYDRP